MDPFTPLKTPPHPNLLPLFSFESSYDLPAWRSWFLNNWSWSVSISALYVFLIFLVQTLMKDRAPFGLRRLLVGWNLSLALFSLGGTLRTWPELGYLLFGESQGGESSPWHKSVCGRDLHNAGAAYWGLLFTLSKAVELGDTLFIVLRKQPLIFLHWYHHLTVLTYTWYTYYSYDATSRWFMVMNYPVHTLMYTYYTLRSLRLPLPRPISMLITMLQLTQMVVGVVVNVYALYVKKTGGDCLVQEEHVKLALVMYCSYFFLFVNFFHAAYLKRSSGGSSSSRVVDKKVL